jgi:EAL domain-containing protein (putative c-di-GMP-specific phosphodiesterase class I)
VTLDDGQPVGVEALVRWQPPGHLLHLPAEFLELAEETGEILPIGRWVISEGCRRVRAWQLRYDMPDLRLYVNLSARQFRDPGLVPIIRAAIAETGFDIANLTLEITEGTLLTPGFETVERIGELRALGLRLAIDDFRHRLLIARLPARVQDRRAQDRPLVRARQHGVGDAHVLSQAIVELGRALSLDMIAEGIETQPQADWFSTLGCRLGQGYLYARPMAAPDLDRYLRRQVGLAQASAAVAAGWRSARGRGMPGCPAGSRRSSRHGRWPARARRGLSRRPALQPVDPAQEQRAADGTERRHQQDDVEARPLRTRQGGCRLAHPEDAADRPDAGEDDRHPGEPLHDRRQVVVDRGQVDLERPATSSRNESSSSFSRMRWSYTSRK